MEVWETIEHILEHSIADTLYLIPFLYITYVAMEWLEHKSGTRIQNAIKKAGPAGPFIGAILGVIPQCGFSASAATLYAGRVVTVGTLIAVFLSTSDEMLPIFLAESVPPVTIVAICATKVGIGIVVGFLADIAYRIAKRRAQKDRDLRIHELCKDVDCGCGRDCEQCREHPELAYAHKEDCPEDCDHFHHEHDHSHDHVHGWKVIFKSALKHTAQIMVFVFLITLALDAVLETVGEEALESVLGGDSFFSIAITSLVGLIPNCAASLLIARLYVEGILGSGAMIAGLLVSAGIGFLVLVRTNKHQKQNAAIIIGMYVVSVLAGCIVGAFGITFGLT